MNSNSLRRMRAFTLIEMVVVLAVLAILTLVALRSTAGTIDRARYEQTRKLLQDVEEAIIGRQGAGANDNIPFSYISDMGALPAAPDLSDLWQLPLGASTNHPAVDLIDPEVKLPSGWRGPYLQLAPGSTKLADGWGFSLNLILPTALSPEFSFRSLGADSQPGGNGYDADFDSVIIIDAKADNDPQKIHKAWARVSGTLRVESAPAFQNWHVVVYAYQPDPATGGLIAIPQDGGPQAPAGGAPFNFNYTFEDVNNRLTPGARVFRAYLYDDAQLPNFNNNPRDAALHGGGRVSDVPAVRVLRWGANVVPAGMDLIIH